MRDPDDFPANPWRRRLLIVVLAVVTAGTVLVNVLKTPQGVTRSMPTPPPDAAPCGAGQTSGCVGGMAGVIAAPGAASAAAAAALR